MANNPPFTAFGDNAPNTSSFNAIMASLMSDGSPPPQPLTSTAASASSTVSGISASATDSTSNQQTPSTLSTVPSPSRPSGSSTATSTSGSTGTISSGANPSGSNAASTADGGLLTSERCNSISCSPGLQAAVAVPVVVGLIAIAALMVFLAKRRKKRSEKTSGSQEKAKKKWTRHLRIFSFDAELLTGGRFSSSNSMRSGGSREHVAHATQNQNQSSVHSIEDAAPPYRDAITHVQQPNMTQTGAGLAAGGLATTTPATTTLPRSPSRASAPPPYGQEDNQVSTGPATPATASTRDPFSDTHLLRPADSTSPFRDPSEDGRSVQSRPTISRNSSVHTGLSTTNGSDAGSIREAQIGRHISIASGGRITNVRNSSQSPPSQSPPGHTPPATD